MWLDISRFFLGVSIGISTVAAPVFIAGSSPVKIRGALIVGYQVATVAGIMVAYFADYIFASSGSWRIMLGLSAVASALVLVVLLRLPDTPRWYLMRGRRDDALRTLRMVDPTADAERSVREIESDLTAERGGHVREMLRIVRFGEPPSVVPAMLGEEAGRCGAAIAAWRAAGIDEAELAAWEP